MDAAMMANAFPLMPQRHAAASAVLDLKDMRLLLPLVIRAAERRRVKRSDRVSPRPKRQLGRGVRAQEWPLV
jgi:hypothetical protein